VTSRSWRLSVVAYLLALVGALVVVSPPATADAAARPVVAVVGDSYTAAWGAVYKRFPPTTEGAWWRYTAQQLGWTPGTIVASPGGGYVKRGDNGTFAQALRAHPIDPETDYVLIQGGLNDEAQSPSAVMTGVRDVLSVIRAQAPGAVPIIIGGFLPSPSTVTPGYVQVARAIGDSRATGTTRYMTGFMCSFSLATDRRHPDAAGHRTIGRFVAWHIAHGLDNAPPLHKDPTGSFYTV
jgi:lysophospholipase L1-like esterase